jgi:hypothetical protein
MVIQQERPQVPQHYLGRIGEGSTVTQEKDMVPDKFIVAYAKIVVDRDDGIMLQGVYFGGIGDTLPEAENLARECVNTVRGGTILPKVLRVQGDHKVIDALYEATEKFERVTANMVETDQIINTKRGRKK